MTNYEATRDIIKIILQLQNGYSPEVADELYIEEEGSELWNEISYVLEDFEHELLNKE